MLKTNCKNLQNHYELTFKQKRLVFQNADKEAQREIPASVEAFSDKTHKEVMEKLGKADTHIDWKEGKSASELADELATKIFQGKEAQKIHGKSLIERALNDKGYSNENLQLWLKSQKCEFARLHNKKIEFYPDNKFDKPIVYRDIIITEEVASELPESPPPADSEQTSTQTLEGELGPIPEIPESTPQTQPAVQETYTVTKKQTIESLAGEKGKTVPQAKAIEEMKKLGASFKDGDKIEIKRFVGKKTDKNPNGTASGYKNYTAKFNEKDNQFYYNSGNKALFFPGDKITFTAIETKVKETQKLPTAKAREQTMAEKEITSKKERQVYRQMEYQRIEGARAQFDVPTFLTRNGNYEIESKTVLEILDNPESWKTEWSKQSKIEGIRLIKGVVMSEPLLAKFKDDPDKIRTILHQAITDGADNNITAKDIVDLILKRMDIRMPHGTTGYENSEPPLVDYDLAQEELELLLKGKHSNATPELINFYHNLVITTNRLGSAIQALRGNSGEVEASEKSYAAEKLRTADLQVQTYNVKAFWDASVLLNDTENSNMSLKASRELPPNAAGLQLNDDVCGPQFSELIGKSQNKLVLIRTLFRAYPDIDQLIQLGCIKKVANTSKDNFVIDKLPEPFKEWLLQGASKGKTNLEKLFDNPYWYINRHQETLDYVNPAMKYLRMINMFFPRGEGKFTHADTVEGTKQDYDEREARTEMSANFANDKFMEILKGRGGMNRIGKINVDALFGLFKELLEKGMSRIQSIYRDPDDYNKKMITLTGVLMLQQNPTNGRFHVNISQDNFFERLKGNNQAKEVIQILKDLMQVGLSISEQQQESERQKNLSVAGQELTDALNKLHPEERAQLKNAVSEHLRKQNVPEDEIEKEAERVTVKALPIMLGIGLNFNAGQVGAGIGVGVNFPIPLGENGEYGILSLGGGIGFGAGTEGATLGPGIAAMYKTPNLGPFSLFAGGSVGLNALSMGAGAAATGGLEIDFGGKEFKHKLDIGLVATSSGLLIPGVIFNRQKDHEYSMDILINDGLKEFGFTTVDQASNVEEKARLIMQNPRLRFAVMQANENAKTAQEIVTEYERYRTSFVEMIAANYDETVDNGGTYGIGITSDGRFILGIGTDVLWSKDRKLSLRATKSKEQMHREAEVTQNLVIEKLRQAKTESEKQKIIIELKREGEIVVSKTGGLAVPMEGETLPDIALPETADGGIKEFETRLNTLYSLIGARVKYDESMQMFELIIDKDQKTNYEFAVDSGMNKGGLVFLNKKLFLDSEFAEENTLTIRRTNLKYVEPAGDVNNLSIFTISNEPDMPAMEIYNNTPQLIASRKGGEYYPTEGFNVHASNRISTSPQYRLNDESFHGRNSEPNSAEFDENYKKARPALDEGSITDIKRTEIREFAKSILKDISKRLTFKKIRNATVSGLDHKPLTDLVNKEWADKHNGKEPDLAELQVILSTLNDESFVEMDSITNPKEREKQFKKTMERQSNIDVVKSHFSRLIEQNHQKYPEGHPGRINMTAEEITNQALKKAITLNINANENEPGVVKANQTDHYVVMVNTDKLGGFALDMRGKDIDDKELLIGTTENYAELLASAPNSLEANLARLALETFSPVPRLEELTEVAKINKFLNSPLSLSVHKWLDSPYTKGLFSNPEYRDLIVKFIANPAQIVLDAAGMQAVREYYDLISGINQARLEGKTEYVMPNNPKISWKIKLDIKDGVYKQCTNYTQWMSEDLIFVYAEAPANREGFVGIGTSTVHAKSKAGVELTYLDIGAAAAFKPAAGPPPRIKPEAPAKTVPATEKSVNLGGLGPDTPIKNTGDLGKGTAPNMQ